MKELPPLQIYADIPARFQLSDLPIAGLTITGDNKALFQIYGLSFIISLHQPIKTKIALRNCKRLFWSDYHKPLKSIGIVLSAESKNRKQMFTVHQMLMGLGQYIGKLLNAVHVAWLPGKVTTGFGYFREVVETYLGDGVFPVMAMVSFTVSDNSLIYTTGVQYFASQEICLSVPVGYNDADAMKLLVRIVHDVATNGTIDNVSKSKGMKNGETVRYKPDLKTSMLFVELKN